MPSCLVCFVLFFCFYCTVAPDRKCYLFPPTSSSSGQLCGNNATNSDCGIGTVIRFDVVDITNTSRKERKKKEAMRLTVQQGINFRINQSTVRLVEPERRQKKKKRKGLGIGRLRRDAHAINFYVPLWPFLRIVFTRTGTSCSIFKQLNMRSRCDTHTQKRRLNYSADHLINSRRQ